ncbi:hypothetical protein EYF80_035910 [Liparis tanakae]|uniref:Uncharacterized protein n=1 Tax=Liparis tanakae TaxID=230148 RepID=A0A4Z2GKL8_9TELE|nr:hypothetical protein EYF80_035910 [Liparis tanakae]
MSRKSVTGSRNKTTATGRCSPRWTHGAVRPPVDTRGGAAPGGHTGQAFLRIPKNPSESGLGYWIQKVSVPPPAAARPPDKPPECKQVTDASANTFFGGRAVKGLRGIGVGVGGLRGCATGRRGRRGIAMRSGSR